MSVFGDRHRPFSVIAIRRFRRSRWAETRTSERDAFTKAVIAAWSEASNYVHPTARQIRETLELRAAGSSPGFETVAELTRAAGALFDATSYAVVIVFHVIGPSFTGDILVDAFDADDRWPFHASRFVAAVDANFDYKAERQSRLSEIRIRRESRVGSNRV
jgi:hypothetical protein